MRPSFTLSPFTPESPHFKRLGPIYHEALGLDWEAERRSLLHYYERFPGFRGLVARVEDEVVGVGWGTRTGAGEWLHDRVTAQLGASHPALRDAWLLNILAVRPADQRRGIGAALHDALLAAQPCPRALICTRVENGTARALYERRGWRYFEPPCLIDTGRGQIVVLRREGL
jgi:ribosomal protein S18 acetylase RimI-like enzyme